ncbi:MAG: DUF5009 domain-containing protein [Ignavibacteriales bacterium]|nr:DUF5009 domain-containing protein [Ignavibacteriales bacterium]
MSTSSTTLNIESTSKRARALDAVRGFAILTMFLSGRVPFGVLPDWMYHAQVPPPLHKFIDTLPGITWVDLVFPFFLFSMGAAIPLALSKRIEEDVPKWKIYFGIFERGLLLVGFAIYDQHIRPYSMNSNPTTITWLTSLLGFVLLFPVLWRMPKTWKPVIQNYVRAAGWIGAILFMVLVRFPETSFNGQFFSLFRSDIIILVLANVAVSGSIVWIFTRSNWYLRFGLLGILLAVRLTHLEPGWIQFFWNGSANWWFRWIGNIYFQQYLFVIIPGTIAGDLILRWMKSPQEKISTEIKSSKSKLIYITLLMFGFILVLLVGLKGRWVEATTIISFSMCALGWWFLSDPKNEMEKLFKNIYTWGAFWLVLGLIFEPYEGGIKKDHPTMSYYFITSGLASFLFIGFSIIIDIFKRKWLNLLVYNGQNPLIAYAGITNLLPPLLALTMLGEFLNWITPTPWLGVLRALFETFLLGYFVSLFTKRKIFLRT